MSIHASQVVVTSFLRGPLVATDRLDEVLSALEVTELFRPTSFGRDERKRVKYDRSKALAATAGGRSLFLWHRDMLSDAAHLELGEENPLLARFSFSLEDRARVTAGLVSDADTLIERLRPVMLGFMPVFEGDALVQEMPELWKRLSETRPPRSPELVQRLGLGDVAPATYFDEGVASAIGETALRELGAQPRGLGYWVMAPTPPMFDDMKAWIEARWDAREVLMRHGLAGRVGQTPQMPTYYGPHWKAPQSWTRKLPAVAERRVAGPNV